MRDPAQREDVSPTATPAGVGFAPIDAAKAGKIPAPTQGADFYKRHSLAAQNWGAIGESGTPLRQVSADEARDTVLNGLLDIPLERSGRSPREWVVAVIVHIVIVAALVLIPLAFLQRIDTENMQAMYLTMPRPPAPAPPPPSAPDLPVKRAVPHFHAATITMPTAIPKKIVEVKDESAPEVNAGGVTGGTLGGETGGVLGGVLGGVGNGPAPPPPPPAAVKKGIHQVGGDVKPPRAISTPQPEYPVVARTAKIEGSVVIEAVIDEEGNVVQARAVSGPGLLIAAALQAVLKWKYEPTILDGMPAAVRMQVTVGFHLH
jgi:protein TonB